PVIDGVAMRDDHVEPVHSATLEEADENRAVDGGGGRWKGVEAERGPSQEERGQPYAERGDASGLHKHPSRNPHVSFLHRDRLSPPCAAFHRPIAPQTPG